MAENDGQEKSEQPTSKKLEDSRQEGKVPKSIEINSLAIFGSGLLLLFFSRNFIGNQFSRLSINIFSSLGKLDISMALLKIYVIKAAIFFILTMAPFLLGLFIMGIVAGYGQVGFRITPKALMPKLSSLDPIKGLKNKFFSAQPFFELSKSVVKLFIIGWFSYIILKDMIVNTIGLVDYSVEQIVQFTINNSIEFLWKVTLVYVAIAAVDLIYQKHKFKKNQMMTKQEVKEEHKQTEGSPEVKSHIKSKQFEMARMRMTEEVPKADVVITNPTHFAVALKYDVGNFSAPKVVAKGKDDIAQKIKKIAKENDVPVHEDVQLARALYKACNIGDEIPENLFKAVAQILAYIFQLKKDKKRKSII